MNQEQKEIALWAGGTAVLVIIGWILIASRASGVSEQRAEADSAHERYRELYLAEDEERIPAQEAIARFTAMRDEQARELAVAEGQVVWPGSGAGVPPEFENFRFDAEGGDIDYTTALDLVSRVGSRLQRRAESLGVGLPADLPLQAEGALSTEDGPRRSLQMAQVCAYAAMVDLAMDAGVDTVGPIQIESAGGWADATGAYALVPVSSVLECSYESADVILRSLERNAFGLAVHRGVLDYQEDGGFRFTLSVHLVVPNREDWNLSGADEGTDGRRRPARQPTRDGSGRGTRRSVR